MRQTMTLLDMILAAGYDPFDEQDLLKFINEYWVYNYDIDENVLAKLKLMFVSTYMYREIQFPELSISSSLSPTKQWKLALTRYLREQEDWYVSLYDKLVGLDPFAFTEMESSSHGTGSTNSSTSNTGSSTDVGEGTVKTSGTTTTNDTVDSENTTDDTSTSTNNSTSEGDTKNTGQNANGIGTIDGGTDPVSVVAGNVVVTDSNMNGGTSEFKNKDESTGTNTSNGTSKGTSTSKGTGESSGETESNNKNTSESTSTGTGETSSKNDSTTTVKGAVVSKIDLQLKYLNAFRNINKEFVNNAWILFQSTFM